MKYIDDIPYNIHKNSYGGNTMYLNTDIYKLYKSRKIKYLYQE